LSRLAASLAGIELQNPLLLAAGTAAYGDEIAGVIALDRLGGIVTKAVSLEPRSGAAAPRVAEFPGGMINAVGLANPGVEAVREVHLPWLTTNLSRARILVNVVGFTVGEFAEVIRRLQAGPLPSGYELNLSCPNVKAGGTEFGADPAALTEVVKLARSATNLPLFVKLAPTLTDIAAAAQAALDAGANGITVINTIPGLVVDLATRRPTLGYGTGGVSGPGLLPVGVLATSKVWRATGAPIIGVGGIATAEDALQYIVAGATAFAVGTAALRDPRVPERLVARLDAWCVAHGVNALSALRGSLTWPQ
jgi:dihydroorotate dehydrogenase (NAD+) catalytic subunit